MAHRSPYTRGDEAEQELRQSIRFTATYFLSRAFLRSGCAVGGGVSAVGTRTSCSRRVHPIPTF